MKKICIVTNHFQFQDGIVKTLVGLANELAKRKDVEITIRPLYKFQKQMLDYFDKKINIKPVFGIYFKGMPKIVDMIPKGILYKLIVGGRYDAEIAYCENMPIKIIAASTNKNAKKYMWMHIYKENLMEYLKKADKVFCVSRCNSERLKSESGGSVNTDFLYNLVDDKKVVSLGGEMCDLPSFDGITFCSVGRHSPEKGYMRLLNCVYKLKQNGYKLRLVLVGDGPEHEALKKRACDMSLNDDIIFTGAQTNPHKYTSRADIFICSSFYEGYSTACTEAIMLGIPVLTTEVSGAKEIIDESECGMLVGFEDDDLYNAMKKILENPQIIACWKEIVLTTRQKFSYDYRAKKIYDVLDI